MLSRSSWFDRKHHLREKNAEKDLQRFSHEEGYFAAGNELQEQPV